MRCGTTWNRLRWAVMLAAGSWLFEGGCAGFLQRELEVLVAAEANGPLIYSSFLYEVFGPGLLSFTNRLF